MGKNISLARILYRFKTLSFRGVIQKLLPPELHEKCLLNYLEFILKFDALAIRDLVKATNLIKVFDDYGIDYSDKVILDFGSGQNQNLMRILLAHGAAKAYTVDKYITSPKDKTYHSNLIRWLKILDNSKVSVVKKSQVEHHNSLTDFSLDSIDIIVSTSVLEHISDPGDIIEKFHTIMKGDGIMIHSIDFRDHTDFRKPLDFLKYDEETWQRKNPQAVFTHTNRLRLVEFENLFKQRGFKILDVYPYQKIKVTEEERKSFNKKFHNFSLEQLGILSARIIVQK